MALMVSSATSFHWVRSVSAHTHGHGALTLTLSGDRDASDCQLNQGEVVIFTDDVALTERLIAAINGAAKPVETKLIISEPSTRDAGPILVCDGDHNDIAEFYHNEHATVGQTYETALDLAQKLVTAA